MAGLAPISQALAQEDGAISEPQRAIVYPDLGDEAPKVAVVFDAPAGEAKVAAIYALVEQRWMLMHHGDYTRGSLLAGRGGKGNRFRLVTQAEGFADLSFANDHLQLFSGGERSVLQPK